MHQLAPARQLLQGIRLCLVGVILFAMLQPWVSPGAAQETSPTPSSTAAPVFCPVCGAENKPASRFCFKDGTALPAIEPARIARSFVQATETYSAEEIQAAIHEAARSVVRIRVKADANLRYPALDDEGNGYLAEIKDEEKAVGSGFVIDAEGFVVTNAHVAAPFGAGAELSVDTIDGRSFPAKLVGYDDASDLALLKVEARDLPAVSWGDSEQVLLGEETWALGNPLDIGFSMTRGTISSVVRTRVGMNQVENFLHSDSFVTMGNSGGPLISVRGLVLGVNDMGYTAYKSQGFSIPSRMAHLVVDRLRTQGAYKRGYLGLEVRSVDAESIRKYSIKRSNGVVVDSVLSGSPAATAGFQQGDLIFGVNGHGATETYLLQEAISSVGAGSPVTILVERGGQSISLPITTGLRPPTPRIDPVLDLQRYIQAEFVEDPKKKEVVLRVLNSFSLAVYYGLQDGAVVDSVLVAKDWPEEKLLYPQVFRAAHPHPVRSLAQLRDALGGMYLGGKLGVTFSFKGNKEKVTSLALEENWAILI